MSEVYCTLLTSDAYIRGVQVLISSLRDAGVTRRIAVLYTPTTLSQPVLDTLQAPGFIDHLISVSPILSRATSNLALLGRPDLVATVTKIHVFNQTQFSRVVFLDADTVVLRNIDELFDVDADFAASPDVGWPDCFNSGMFVCKPSSDTFDSLMGLATAGISFDGGDQGLLNYHFPNWHKLSFTYNVTPTATYSYLPAYRAFAHQVAVIHFIGATKPWHYTAFADGTLFNPPRDMNVDYQGLVEKWWHVWVKHFTPMRTGITIPDYADSFSVSGKSGTAIETSGRPAPNPAVSRLQRDAGVKVPSRDTSPVRRIPRQPPPPLPYPMTAWDATKEAPPPASSPAGRRSLIRNMPSSDGASPNAWDMPTDPSPSIFVSEITQQRGHHRKGSSSSIFPWEAGKKDKEKPSRRFPAEETTGSGDDEEEDFSYVNTAPPDEIIGDVRDSTTTGSSNASSPSEEGTGFGPNGWRNAWDHLPEIGEYANVMANVLDARARRQKAMEAAAKANKANMPPPPPLSVVIPGSRTRPPPEAITSPTERYGWKKSETWDPSKQLEQLKQGTAGFIQRGVTTPGPGPVKKNGTPSQRGRQR